MGRKRCPFNDYKRFYCAPDETTQRIRGYLHGNSFSHFLVDPSSRGTMHPKTSFASTKDCTGSSWLSSQALQLQKRSEDTMIENGRTRLVEKDHSFNIMRTIFHTAGISGTQRETKGILKVRS